MPRLSRRNVRKGGKGRKGKGGMDPQQQPLTRSGSSGSFGQPPSLSSQGEVAKGPGSSASKCATEQAALQKCHQLGESTSSGFMSGMGNLFGKKGNNSGGGRKSRRRGRKSRRRGRKSQRRGRKSRRRSRR